MSWLFSQALVAEYSAGTCSAGELCAPSNGSPMPLAYLPPDRTKDFSRLSRSGATFAPLTDDLGAALLTWFLAGFRARTSALPAEAQALRAHAAACGPTWRGSLARFDPVSRSWRTAQPSLLGDSEECSVTWPRSGMTAGGQCWELPTLVPPTSAIGSGLSQRWPTPHGFSPDGRSNGPSGNELGRAVNQSLRAQWPTPTSSLGTNGGRVTPAKAREGGTLIEALSARTMWPTPDAHMGSGGRTSKTPPTGKRANGTKQQITLNDAVKWATPTARDWKSGKASEATMERNSRPLSEQIGGSLNPTWVEKLMGWPDDWTSLQPMSHVKMCFWLMGMSDGTETGRIKVLRMLRGGDAAQEIQRALGRPVGIHETAILLAELCEHANRPNEARVFMACAEALEDEMRSMRLCEGTTGAPHRPGQGEQRTGEHPDAMQALSRLLAHHGKAYWQDGRWEDATPRVTHGVAHRVDRLKALGNGQVPLCAATAWRMLTGGVSNTPNAELPGRTRSGSAPG